MIEQADAAATEPSDLSAEGITSPAMLLLATPLLVKRALAMFGCSWNPKVLDATELSTQPGLYA